MKSFIKVFRKKPKKTGLLLGLILFLNFYAWLLVIAVLCYCALFKIWFLYRSKTYLFEEFLLNWHDKLRKMEEHTVMTVKLQREVDKYKVRSSLYKGKSKQNAFWYYWVICFTLYIYMEVCLCIKVSLKDILCSANISPATIFKCITHFKVHLSYFQWTGQSLQFFSMCLRHI